MVIDANIKLQARDAVEQTMVKEKSALKAQLEHLELSLKEAKKISSEH